jgi:hypothetical protein
MLADKMKIITIAIIMINIGIDSGEVEKLILSKGRYLFNHLIK